MTRVKVPASSVAHRLNKSDRQIGVPEEKRFETEAMRYAHNKFRKRAPF